MMRDGRARQEKLHIEERSAYASALCSTCKWKCSAVDDGDTPKLIRRSPEQIREEAHLHAINEGHRVSMVETSHTIYDFTTP